MTGATGLAGVSESAVASPGTWSLTRRITSTVTWPEGQVIVSATETDVTSRETRLSIVSVRYWTEQMLTKRRAVDFCRLAASLCPAA